MKSLKKLGIIAVVIVGYVVWVISGSTSKPLTDSTAKVPSTAEESETQSSSMVLPDESVVPVDQTPKEDTAPVKDKVKVSTKDTFIFQDFTPLARKIVVPVAGLQPISAPIISRLIQVKSLREAIAGMQGHGYLSFNTDEIEAYYPGFSQALFGKFASFKLPDYFWSETAGAGQLYFKFTGLREKISADLRGLELSPNFISLISDDTLKLDLNFSGYQVGLQESVKLNLFFKKYAEFFNQTTVTADGQIAIMISSLRAMQDSIYSILIHLDETQQLSKFIAGLKVDGVLLLDLQEIVRYKSELGELIDIEKLNASGMKIDQSVTGVFSHQFDLNDIQKIHQKNITEQQALVAEKKLNAPAYQTYLDLPLEINGDRLLKFSSSISDLATSFAEQKVFAPGTTVEATFGVSIDSLGENIEATYLDVLRKLQADRLLTYSLSNVYGVGKIIFPVQIPEDQFSRLTTVVDNIVGFVEKHNPKPIFKVYLEFVSNPEINQLLKNSTYNILTLEYFDDKTRVLLTTNEIVKIKRFHELVAEISPKAELALKGYLEIDLQLFKIDRHAYQLLADEIEAKTIGLAEVLKSIRGNGFIELYPSTAKFFDQDLIKVITPLFKNNQAAYERWKLIRGGFKMRIPESFGTEVEKGSLREAYEYINQGATPKIKEQRVKQLIQSFSAQGNRDLAVPEKLNEILDILSDNRKISDVLKDKQDEGF